MRKLVIGMALASTAIASPAFAHDDAWYIEGDFGAMIVEDSHFDIGNIGNAATLDHKTGFDGGAAIGYDFGMFRVEAEGSYRRAKTDLLTANSAVVPILTGSNFVAGRFGDPRGHSSALSFMVNGLLDFGPDNGLQGFIGGGAGVARVSYIVQPRATNALTVLDDSDTRFAYQGLAGVRLPLSDHVDIGVKYRFFDVDKLRYVDGAGRSVQTRWRSHSLMGTLAYNFFTPPAPPPPPPPCAPSSMVSTPPMPPTEISVV